MAVRNGMSRYQLCIEALRRAPRMRARAPALIEHCQAMLTTHQVYGRAHLAEIRDWAWSES